MRYSVELKPGHTQFEFDSLNDSFPIKVLVIHDSDDNKRIQYEIEYPGGVMKGVVNAVEVSSGNGKLTGVQLRAIAAKDQLDALLEDDCYDAIKCLAESDPDRLQFYLEIACDKQCVEHSAEARPEHDEIPGEHILKAIKAMALFCYTEIVERGLKKPGLEE
jgi:hypothetical protein